MLKRKHPSLHTIKFCFIFTFLNFFVIFALQDPDTKHCRCVLCGNKKFPMLKVKKVGSGPEQVPNPPKPDQFSRIFLGFIYGYESCH
jgi:hypothetical protein